MAIAAVFGVASTQYQVGQFSRSGPGMFPLLVSVMLFLIGLVTVVRTRFVAAEPVNYNVKNIVVIILSLCGFALISEHINMVLGIIFMVFFSAIGGKGYSVTRNLNIGAGLVAVAFIFRNLLGLNLPLI